MWNFAIARLIRPLSLVLFGCALLVAAGLAGATPALADPGSENAILLDPFDPVPEIGFRHYGADCFHECGYGEGCYHDCGYRHGCHRYCGGNRRCYHSCGYRREGCGDGCHNRCYHDCHPRCYHDCHRGCERDCHPRCERNCETWRDERSDFQAWRWNRLTHRYERQSREWDEKYGEGWYDGDHRYHDGHGRWRDGDGGWHDGDTAKRGDGGPKDGHRDHDRDNELPSPMYNAAPGAGGVGGHHQHDGDEGRGHHDSDEDEDGGDDGDWNDRGPPPDDRGPPPDDRGDDRR